MATIDQIFANINTAIITYAQNHLANPANIVTQLATGITQVIIGIFIAVIAAMLKEVLQPVETSINTIGNNIAGQTTAINTKADESIAQKSNLPKIKPDAPESFDGKPEQVMSFLATLTVYYSALKEETHKNMILFALSRIKGGKENVAS
jgi:hypothetical protein